MRSLPAAANDCAKDQIAWLGDGTSSWLLNFILMAIAIKSCQKMIAKGIADWLGIYRMTTILRGITNAEKTDD